ncbi:hypothetical protein AAIO65_03065 [Erwinia amylovora]
MDAGRNLTLTSEQDSDNYDSKQLTPARAAALALVLPPLLSA